ncbi:DUF4810 domain-containing protein [Marinimicrobium alkaliphilum]|uniref:DUF4810 domain-containing protein n=1 Tax=Marinimicrobium alkaliphilum TaxID=2202654 RepID=UPI000DB9D5AF|nr:DUF4810 domain-containing protein [Marinimicrobium alkaliphilum]
MNKLLLVAIAALLAACSATQTLYSWGPYEETLFIHYHEPGLREDALTKYIAFIDSGSVIEPKLAPGLYAEAGTFMLERGDIESALKFYRLEYEAWPESRPMLSALIENLESSL